MSAGIFPHTGTTWSIITLSAAMLVVGTGSFGCGEDSGSPIAGIPFQGGVEDEFNSDSVEPTYLHPDFRIFFEERGNVVDSNFDGVTRDRHFGHSILLPECSGHRTVKSARLTTRLKALGDGSTDRVNLYVRNNEGQLEHVWGASISRHLNNGTWSVGGKKTFVFDLAAMPNTESQSQTNLLPYLNNGELHIHVQDDTSVDFITLETEIDCNED